MNQTPTPHAKELCSVLVRTLNGEIEWSERKAYATSDKPFGLLRIKADAVARMGQDRKNEKSFILVEQYADVKLSAIYTEWPVLFVINHREDSPMQCIISLVQDSEVPDGSTRYKGYDNKIFNQIIQAIQLAAE